MITPKRLAHLVLRVRDIQSSEEFYTNILGLEVTSRDFGMVFLRADPDPSHELALAPMNQNTSNPSSIGLAHFAWEMNSFDDLKTIYKRLKEHGVNITGVGNHGISIGVYFLDPDGNKIEVFYELPKDKWPQYNLFTGQFPMSLDEEMSSA